MVSIFFSPHGGESDTAMFTLTQIFRTNVWSHKKYYQKLSLLHISTHGYMTMDRNIKDHNVGPFWKKKQKTHRRKRAGKQNVWSTKILQVIRLYEK